MSITWSPIAEFVGQICKSYAQDGDHHFILVALGKYVRNSKREKVLCLMLVAGLIVADLMT